VAVPKKPAKQSTLPPAPQRTLGPISDLERHLPREWWRTLFNSIYLKTDGDVVENDSNTTREVDVLVSAASLEHNDRILDLCCGQGRHTLELARRGFKHVTGVDRSRYLVRLARKRAKTLGYTISVKEGDARRFRLPEHSFHCVALMGNSFGHFDREEDDLQVLENVEDVLIPGGTIALDLVNGEWMSSHFEKRSWEWIDQNHFVCRERSLAADGKRLISREVVVHAEKGVIADQFYAERLYTEASIRELLAKAGFEDTKFHGGLFAASDRNQDLGLMANRMFLTSKSPRKSGRVSKRGVRFPDVTVLMGDPKLPDTVKLNGHFGADDFDTINRLQKALDELPEYRFTYYDSHPAMVSSFMTKPPKFVLNLCDEGYKNDAFMELHVPALMEMFGIQYTGAAPSALGMCYNKSIVRAIADSLDVPVPAETYFDPDDQSATIPSTLPALVKPNFGDSSIGITKNAVVYTPEELVGYLTNLRQQFPGLPVLIQEYLSGREFSVGIIGNPGLAWTRLPILEVDYSKLDPGLPHILGYESKWDPESPYWTQLAYFEANLEEEMQRRMFDYSTLLFERLGCRDYARFDYRMDAKGEPKLLEVNPNPGWSWDGKMNLMAGFAGMRYSDMLRLILEAAQERISQPTPQASSRPVEVANAAPPLMISGPPPGIATLRSGA
jgi:D-alanine-D-alanine ligase